MNLKIKPITKLFYYYYDYKIVMDANSFNDMREGFDFFNSEHSQINTMRVKTVYNNGKVNLYFNGKDLLNYYTKYYKELIQSISGPINDYHHSLILKSNIEIKKTLYYKKYRYKVKFSKNNKNSSSSIGDTNLITKLRDMIRTNPQDYLGTNLYEQRFSYYLTPVVYVTDKQSLMMLELIAKEHISQRIKVITIKEIESNERPDEETN